MGYPLLGLFVQSGVDQGILPNGIAIAVFPEKHILLEVCLSYKAQTFQQSPRTAIAGVAFSKNSVNAFRKSLFD